MGQLTDHFGRNISYLRVSVTDRCNQRCFYCMPEGGVSLFRHSDILTYEEILRIIRVGATLGISKIRITGGEPLIRRQICSLIENIIRIPGILDVSMTTNGVLLKDMARPLFEAGLRRINISIDSLDPEKYLDITKRNFFLQVWEGIREAEALRFHPIKLNVVAIRGVNDDEISAFAKMTFSRPYHVRFIEFMPIGHHNQWSAEKVVPSSEIIARLETIAPLVPIQRSMLDGPSRRYHFEGASGEIGIISALSEHFCQQCNRLRLTPDGKFRPCLVSDEEVDVKTRVREGCSDDEIAEIIGQAIDRKSKGSGAFPKPDTQCMRNMSRIGG